VTAPSPPSRLLGPVARVARSGASSLQQRRAAGKDLHAGVRAAVGEQRRQLDSRLALLLRTLGHPVPPGLSARVRAVEAAMTDADGGRMWLALAVLTARLPLDDEVIAAVRRLRLDGAGAALGPPVAGRRRCSSPGDRRRPATVEVLTGAVAVDVHHTSETDLATGIQRVARETARRWRRDHEVVLVGWTDDYTALRRLTPTEAALAAGEPPPVAPLPRTPPARRRRAVAARTRCSSWPRNRLAPGGSRRSPAGPATGPGRSASTASR
jgi:hypothetical protein